jgi:hypothetical protein
VLGDETAFRDNEIDETVLPGLTAGEGSRRFAVAIRWSSGFSRFATIVVRISSPDGMCEQGYRAELSLMIVKP